MWTLTWKGLLAAKARFVMTALAVIIGTGFVAGSLTFGDTLEQGFDELFTSIVGDADVVIRAAGGDGEVELDDTGRVVGTFPTDVVETLAALDEVRVADGEVEGIAPGRSPASPTAPSTHSIRSRRSPWSRRPRPGRSSSRERP
jgi:putative ABC transport system permease protein